MLGWLGDAKESQSSLMVYCNTAWTKEQSNVIPALEHKHVYGHYGEEEVVRFSY